MIGRTFFEEDQALKRFAGEPAEQKPRFNWAEAAALPDPDRDNNKNDFLVQNGGEKRAIGYSDIAETVGAALTDLLLSRNETEIFTEQNLTFVSEVSRAVARDLLAHKPRDPEGNMVLNHEEFVHVIERALEKMQAYDVARSLMTRYYLKIQGRGANGNGGPVKTEERERQYAKASVKVIRRNGDLVAWNAGKIEIAVRKAFLALHMDSDDAVDIAQSLSEQMAASGLEYIHIEDLQDKVQEELMRQGHFKVAEAFILYRAHRSAGREVEVEEADQVQDDSSQETMIVVKRPDGTTWLWDGLDLRKRIEFAMLDLNLDMSPTEIEKELHRTIYPEMTEEALKTTIILNARSLIEQDAEFSRFAARILLTFIYEEVMGWDIMRDGINKLPEFHRRAFKANIRRAIEIERVNPEIVEALPLDKLAEAIDPAADMDFDYLGIQTLFDRYLIVDKTSDVHRRLETPQLFWMRVSMGLFYKEGEQAVDRIISLYRLYKSRRFCSSTPTLFNSGTLHSQLSSCYLYKVDDSIESIMTRGIAENAYLSKWAGGLGGSWTAVRGTGSYIKGTNGESQGVIPFLKLHNDQLVAVNQGGKRKGSGCAYMESWHNDIFDFLELRKNTGDDRRRTHDLNTANWIPDLFMRRMEERGDWTLFRSNETADLHDLYGKAFEERYVEYEAMVDRGELWGERIAALELWKAMLRNLFETGHPWITFKDACNVRSPQDHAGVIHSSNLCTEITLNTSEDETAVCNLGSVVLDQHLTADGQIDHEKLRDTIRIAVRALDNVIDINFYPTQAAANANQRHRPIGLGIMGLQNMMYKKSVAYASDAAMDFNDEIMEAVAMYAYEASSDLAEEKGTYKTYKGSKWDRGLLPQDTIDLLESERGVPVEVPRGEKLDWAPVREKIARQGMRNSNVIAIAPTATISNIMGSSPCIEPLYKNLFVKSNLGGDFIMLNPFLVRDLKKLGLWDQAMRDRLKYHDGEIADIDGIPEDVKHRYLTAFGVPWEYIIKAAARRQKWIDQSQSVNLFLNAPDMKQLSHMYRAAWRQGLKTTYYLRTLNASNIEKATIEVEATEKRAVHTTSAGGNDKPTEAEVQACRLDAMQNGGECEACQ